MRPGLGRGGEKEEAAEQLSARIISGLRSDLFWGSLYIILAMTKLPLRLALASCWLVSSTGIPIKLRKAIVSIAAFSLTSSSSTLALQFIILI